MVDLLFALLNFFHYLLWFRSYEAKCVQLGCFCRGIDFFALKFYLDRVVPITPSTILDIRKLETLSYLIVKTTSLCIPSF